MNLKEAKGVCIFTNDSGLEFDDISSEKYRVYVYPDNFTIRIDEPMRLNVSKNGHRIYDAQGVSHYINKGWVHLYWEVHQGSPNFVK
jgi:hypothetical protein